MASRIFLPRTLRLQSLSRSSPLTARILQQRSFQTSQRLQQEASSTIPAKRPVGAFRGGLFGFLLGAVGAGAGMYYYVLEEYRVSNELLTEDIYNLQATVQRVESYVRVLEDRVEEMGKKK